MQVKVWFQNRRTKHKRIASEKTDDDGGSTSTHEETKSGTGLEEESSSPVHLSPSFSSAGISTRSSFSSAGISPRPSFSSAGISPCQSFSSAEISPRPSFSSAGISQRLHRNHHHRIFMSSDGGSKEACGCFTGMPTDLPDPKRHRFVL